MLCNGREGLQERMIHCRVGAYGAHDQEMPIEIQSPALRWLAWSEQEG
jgi:hypothetical protein